MGTGSDAETGFENQARFPVAHRQLVQPAARKLQALPPLLDSAICQSSSRSSCSLNPLAPSQV
jgi:hypothetical protein